MKMIVQDICNNFNLTHVSVASINDKVTGISNTSVGFFWLVFIIEVNAKD